MNRVSNHRYNYSKEVGDRIEDMFVNLMSSKGFDVVAANDNDNMFKHIDFYVNGLGIDVKGGRHDECIWLETVNVRGNNGWLNGEADYICFHFEKHNAFRMFRRDDLLAFVLDNVTETTTNKSDFLKYYTREKWGKKDKIVKVKYDHIKHLKHKTFECI
jgi:hypothetical protein